jgi:Pyruvate/2-oxoacid:ferredoxin oxidoreductase delta subunit/nitroreductase
MVTIDRDKCVGCGSCVKVCHEHCIALVEGAALVDGVARIDYVFCSTCTQCVAVCPQQALSWEGAPPAAYDPARMPSAGQLDELLKERRTIRAFRSDPIDRALLSEIVNYAVYAPAHSHTLRAIIVDDPELIQFLDQAVMRFNERLYDLLYRPRLLRVLIPKIAPQRAAEYLKVQPKLERALEAGRAYPSPPAAFVLLVDDRRTPLARESAQYALYNIALYAQARGIGCRNLVGNQMILNGSRAVRERLGLGRHERLYGTAGLGVPAVRFRNKVEGRTLPIQWNDGSIKTRPPEHPARTGEKPPERTRAPSPKSRAESDRDYR